MTERATWLAILISRWCMWFVVRQGAEIRRTRIV